ncbi:DinF protein [Giardia lamblia P15]|uniref:DinF protein n=1 Tax=Giardia intestinalis (strain P15) TaxID=658858 RepID=E1F424_GIAIA|nr:DinF protein [Giardia lamblia P15]
MVRKSHTTIIQLLEKYMENRYKKQEGYTQGIEQSLIPTFPRYSLMRLIWRGYIINLLLDVVYAGYLVLECIIMIYFTGLHSLLAIAIVYPIYQIAIRGPIISFSLSAASFVHKELEVGHTIFANAYLLGYIILSVCWCTLVSLTIAPASHYIISVIGTSDDLYATNYLVLCSTLGGLSLILDEGMTAIHIVEQRHVLIFTHMLTRYLLKSIFLLLFYTICNKIGRERGENMTSTLATAPIVTDIVVSIPLSVWILFITCHKTIYNYPLATSLNLLKQNKYPWQWKVYKRIIVNSIPHYLKTLYEPFMLLVTNILVAKYYTNSDESITKRISLLLFYLFRHIFMTSSRSFAISYYTSMQTYYFHKFYQCVEAILVKLTLLVYSIGLLVGFTFLVLSPFLMRLLLPINVVDSFILSTLTEVRQTLLLDYCETTIRKAAIAGIILVGLDMVLTIQTLRETYILNTVVCLSRIVVGLVFVLIIGLMNQDNSSVENALLIAEIPTAIGAVFLSIEQIYEHIFLGRLEMFHAMTSKTNSSSLSATDWAEVHQTIAESKAEKRSAYKYLRFLITGRSIDD